jgi:hypothetical protein
MLDTRSAFAWLFAAPARGLMLCAARRTSARLREVLFRQSPKFQRETIERVATSTFALMSQISNPKNFSPDHQISH